MELETDRQISASGLYQPVNEPRAPHGREKSSRLAHVATAIGFVKRISPRLSARDRLLAELDDAAEAAETIRDLEDRLVEAAARWRARLAFATRIRRCSPKRSEL